MKPCLESKRKPWNQIGGAGGLRVNLTLCNIKSQRGDIKLRWDLSPVRRSGKVSISKMKEVNESISNNMLGEP